MSPSYDTLAREILDVVPSVMRMIRVEMRSQRSPDLAVPQFRALMFINRNPGTSLRAVAHHLGLTAPTVCKMVDGLVLTHLVQREPSPQDRRKITLTMTSQGQEILEHSHQETRARLAEVLAHLTPRESETVMQAMKLLHPLFSPSPNHMEAKPV
jgi:DNA-binding MarR family transcriptional regulator